MPGIFAKTMAAVCGHCKLGSSFKSGTTHKLWPRFESNPSLSPEAATCSQTWVCSHCGMCTIMLVEYAAGDGMRDPVETRILWPVPSPRELDPSVPAEIRDRFLEGSRCEIALSFRGAAALYRAAVEELCKEQGATKKTLYDKINELAGRLSADLIDDLHEARMLGNDSVHQGLVYSADEVANVADLIIEMTDDLYVQPAKKAAMRQSRAQRRATAQATL